MLIRKDERNRMVHRHKQTKKRKKNRFIHIRFMYLYLYYFIRFVHEQILEITEFIYEYSSGSPERIPTSRYVRYGRKLTLSNYHQT